MFCPKEVKEEKNVFSSWGRLLVMVVVLNGKTQNRVEVCSPTVFLPILPEFITHQPLGPGSLSKEGVKANCDLGGAGQAPGCPWPLFRKAAKSAEE